MLLILLSALLHISASWAVPTEHSTLTIPVRDIIRKDLSAHEAHPNFELYTRWLETPQGSYIRRDPKAAFKKYLNIRSIDCSSNIKTCLITSTIPLKDRKKSKRENEDIVRALEEQLKARDDDPATLFERAVNKRAGYANTLYTGLHLKTYHDLGPDNPVGGFQHYITWDFKCQTLQFSSSGFQLTDKRFNMEATNKVSAGLTATLIGDNDPGTQHAVSISMVFGCGLFTNKCCLTSTDARNFVGGKEVVVPKKEPTECFMAKDVSKQNCESFHPGWCGVHIRQYQKNEGPGFHTENYRFDVTLFDADQELVGEVELLSIPSGTQQEVGSTLPYTFGVKAPDTDGDAVYMSYNGASWGSNDQDHHCNFGKYDSGHRDGDCGFTC